MRAKRAGPGNGEMVDAWDGEGASADECRGAQKMVRWTTETAERDEGGLRFVSVLLLDACGARLLHNLFNVHKVPNFHIFHHALRGFAFDKALQS